MSTKFVDEIAIQDGTNCHRCGIPDLVLLIPAEGNHRRFQRHYRCTCCQRVFSKYDYGYLFLSWLNSAFALAKRLIGFSRADESMVLDSLVAEPSIKWVKKTEFRGPARREIQRTFSGPIGVYAYGDVRCTLEANKS